MFGNLEYPVNVLFFYFADIDDGFMVWDVGYGGMHILFGVAYDNGGYRMGYR